MTLQSSMYAAANGIVAHGDALGAVSDNIANLNTPGFKQNLPSFEDVLATTLADSSNVAAGQGARMTHTEAVFTQGTLLTTERNTDLAIQGSGFFVCEGNYNGNNGQFFTRNGRFTVNAQGELVNPHGLAVQGYLANGKGVLQTNMTNLQVGGVALIPPKTTDTITLAANLDSTAPTPPAFLTTDPGDTSTFATSVSVYDTRGTPHNTDIYFRENGTGSFDWHALVDGGELVGGEAGKATEIGNGTLDFTTGGFLQKVTGNTMTASFTNATANQVVTVDFGDAISTGGTGIQGITSYSGSSDLTEVQQDGFSEGALLGISVSSDGEVTGGFTNGQSRLLGKVAVATFPNLGGLNREGGTLYHATKESGLPAIGVPGGGGRGSIAAGCLEASNVNLSQEFISLMAYQRGFEANTRTVSAANEMMQQLVQLGR